MLMLPLPALKQLCVEETAEEWDGGEKNAAVCVCGCVVCVCMWVMGTLLTASVG